MESSTQENQHILALGGKNNILVANGARSIIPISFVSVFKFLKIFVCQVELRNKIQLKRRIGLKIPLQRLRHRSFNSFSKSISQLLFLKRKEVVDVVKH